MQMVSRYIPTSTVFRGFVARASGIGSTAYNEYLAQVKVSTSN